MGVSQSSWLVQVVLERSLELMVETFHQSIGDDGVVGGRADALVPRSCIR